MPIHHRGHKRELVEKQPDIYKGRMNINDKQQYRPLLLHKQECVLFMLWQI